MVGSRSFSKFILLEWSGGFILQQNTPVFITGEGFKALIDVLINKNNLQANGEKLISENLVSGNQFEHVFIIPHSTALIQLYETRKQEELTATRYSLYPQLLNALTATDIDIEAYNQFEEPEIISLKNKSFFCINLPEPSLFKILRKECVKEFNCNGHLPELELFSFFKEINKNDKFYMQKVLDINNNITTKEKALMCYFMAEMC